ncbi:RBM46 protein, partial [Pseudoatta argentina]
MENKSRESRKSNRKRGSRKEEKREFRRMKNLKNEEISVWPQFPVADMENAVGVMEQEISLDPENLDNGSEKSKPSLMCPSLRRQLQTHKNVLRLLHEYKLASTQINGQRILSIQPIRWSGPTPGIECEIFVGRIPKTIYEDTLYPLFKMVGEVFQIRLMVDMAELTRGYCFIMYTNPEDAARAIIQLDQYEISPGRKIRVLASVNKCKLYIGPLPWHIESEEVVRVIYASAWDIEYVSIYRFPNHDAAYAIVSFKSHRNAALARRKLRPERLFKCNEVHVEWARVDWNPCNVSIKLRSFKIYRSKEKEKFRNYEDRGSVDDKGDVQITRKYLQSKKTTSTSVSPIQNESSNRGRKKILPICPPNGQVNPSVTKPTNHSCNATRYSTMLAISGMNDSLQDEKQQMLTDINDNVQPLNKHYHFQDKMQRKKEANSFPNFDMWSSNLVPTLPNSSTSPDSPLTYDSLDKFPSNSSHDWENDAKYFSPSLFNGYQCSNDSGVSNCQPSFSTNKTVDQTRQTATVHGQNYPACYVLLQQPAYPQSSAVIRHAHNCDCRSYQCNEQIGMRRSITDPGPISQKFDYEFWHGGILMKSGNGNAMSRTTNIAASCYVKNYAPNLVMNFAPICPAAENMTTCFSPLVANGSEKRPRPILKQEATHAQL